MAMLGPTEEERLALCAWLTANSIDPNTVPLHSSLSIVETDGQRSIEYTEYVLDEETGRTLPDPVGGARTRGVRAPCVVDPPDWLHIPSERARS